MAVVELIPGTPAHAARMAEIHAEQHAYHQELQDRPEPDLAQIAALVTENNQRTAEHAQTAELSVKYGERFGLSGGVFEVVLVDIYGIYELALERGGPLENGKFVSGSWTPDGLPQAVYAAGFGIDGSGNAFYDATGHGAALGFQAQVWLDPSNDACWLVRDPYKIVYSGNVIVIGTAPASWGLSVADLTSTSELLTVFLVPSGTQLINVADSVVTSETIQALRTGPLDAVVQDSSVTGELIVLQNPLGQVSVSDATATSETVSALAFTVPDAVNVADSSATGEVVHAQNALAPISVSDTTATSEAISASTVSQGEVQASDATATTETVKVVNATDAASAADSSATTETVAVQPLTLSIKVADSTTTSEAIALAGLALPINVNVSDGTSTSETIAVNLPGFTYQVNVSDATTTSEMFQVARLGLNNQQPSNGGTGAISSLNSDLFTPPAYAVIFAGAARSGTVSTVQGITVTDTLGALTWHQGALSDGETASFGGAAAVWWAYVGPVSPGQMRATAMFAHALTGSQLDAIIQTLVFDGADPNQNGANIELAFDSALPQNDTLTTTQYGSMIVGACEQYSADTFPTMETGDTYAIAGNSVTQDTTNLRAYWIGMQSNPCGTTGSITFGSTAPSSLGNLVALEVIPLASWRPSADLNVNVSDSSATADQASMNLPGYSYTIAVADSSATADQPALNLPNYHYLVAASDSSATSEAVSVLVPSLGVPTGIGSFPFGVSPAASEPTASNFASAGPPKSTLQFLIPLYIYPSSIESTFWNVLAANPANVAYVIANPASGPGPSANSDYTTGINNLRAVGIKVLGYVDTDYGLIAQATVEGLMDNWQSFYSIDGYYFDRADDVMGAHETYYSALNAYAKGKNPAWVTANGYGTPMPQTYWSTCDINVNTEEQESDLLSNFEPLIGYESSEPANSFCQLAYFSTLANLYNDLAMVQSRFAYYVYLAEDGEYQTQPSYWSQLQSRVIAAVVGPPAPSVSDSTTTAEQITLNLPGYTYHVPVSDSTATSEQVSVGFPGGPLSVNVSDSTATSETVAVTEPSSAAAIDASSPAVVTKLVTPFTCTTASFSPPANSLLVMVGVSLSSAGTDSGTWTSTFGTPTNENNITLATQGGVNVGYLQLGASPGSGTVTWTPSSTGTVNDATMKVYVITGAASGAAAIGAISTSTSATVANLSITPHAVGSIVVMGLSYTNANKTLADEANCTHDVNESDGNTGQTMGITHLTSPTTATTAITVGWTNASMGGVCLNAVEILA